MIVTKRHDEPPQPVVIIRSQIGGMFNDQRPLGQRQTEAS